MNAIDVSHLRKRFGAVTAVDDVSFTVPQGIVFGLLGPNGAGKSTMIKILTTLAQPTSGSAQVAGFDVRRNALEVRRRIGYVPQQQSADPDLSGYENLLVFARLYGIGGAQQRQRILEALELMDLGDARHRLVRHYSGGMIRRLEIAQSMLNDPEVLFMDEPTLGLDPLARHMVWDRVAKLRRTYETTIFLTTHYMDEAETLCDIVAFLHQGCLKAYGKPAELTAQYRPGADLDDLFIALTGRPAAKSVAS
jgi:ABC-2 type transport system ATP-binding protein